MSRRPTGRRNTRALNARLDHELDADLIAWLDAQPSGRCSDAIRDLLRDGLRARERQTDISDQIRAAISEALAGVQVVAAQQGVSLNANEIEEAFGEKLDRMLSNLT